MCKRLMEERKKVGVIQYYNVLFIMELMTDKDICMVYGTVKQWNRQDVYEGYT